MRAGCRQLLDGVIGAWAQSAVKIAPKAQLRIYPGAPHGLTATHKDQVNQDLLLFLKS